jgi:hypothetical protein
MKKTGWSIGRQMLASASAKRTRQSPFWLKSHSEKGYEKRKSPESYRVIFRLAVRRLSAYWQPIVESKSIEGSYGFELEYCAIFGTLQQLQLYFLSGY